MLVYRIENDFGTGIYTGSSIGYDSEYQTIFDPSCEKERHPTPHCDGGELEKWAKKEGNAANVRENYFCGFGSQEQMLDWFPPRGFTKMIKHFTHRGEIEKWGVSVYRVDEQFVKKGNTQCMFYREKAKKIARHRLFIFAGPGKRR